MVERGNSDVAIAKHLGLTGRRVRELALVAEVIAFDQSGQLGERLEDLVYLFRALQGGAV